MRPQLARAANPPPPPSAILTRTIFWDLDNVRPPAGADPAALLHAVVAGPSTDLDRGVPSITLFANSATAAALPRAWDPPPPGATLATLSTSPGAVDQAIKAAAVAFVMAATAPAASLPLSPSRPSLTIISSDAAAFVGLLRWASSLGCRTRVVGAFPGARPGRPDGWRRARLAAAADEAVQWGEVVERAQGVEAGRGGGG